MTKLTFWQLPYSRKVAHVRRIFWRWWWTRVPFNRIVLDAYFQEGWNAAKEDYGIRDGRPAPCLWEPRETP